MPTERVAQCGMEKSEMEVFGELRFPIHSHKLADNNLLLPTTTPQIPIDSVVSRMTDGSKLRPDLDNCRLCGHRS